MGTSQRGVYVGKARWRRATAMLGAAAVLVATFVVTSQPDQATAASPCGAGVNAIACENRQPGTDPSVWDIDGAGDPSIQGFATDISVNAGNRIDFKIDTPASNYTIDIYRTGWYQGLGARHIASVTPSATLPSAPAGVHHRCDHGALRLRYVGGVGVVERPHHGRLGRVHRFAQANRHRWPEPHHLHRPQRRQSLGCGLPDLRHELAGVQHVRRCELLPGRGQRSRLQAQLQPAVRHTQLGAGAGLLLQLRVRDRALHGAQRLRRLLRVRYRLRSLWRRTAQPQGVHVGRARRVLVGSAARERRGSARRRREPAVPERERGLLARAVGTLGGFIAHRLPDPRVVQGDLGQCRQQGRRQDRPVAGVDRHLA